MEQSGGSGGGGEYGGEDEDDEETQLRRAIELSMAEAGGGGEPADAGDGAAGGRGRGGRGNRGRGRGGALDQYACCTSVCLPTLLTSLCACAQVERDAWVGSCSNNAKVIQIQTSGVGGPQQGQFKALIKSAGGNCDDHDLAKILDKLYV